MTPIPTARQLVAAASEAEPADTVMLAHKDRALRLRQFETVSGESFLVDLPRRMSLEGAYGFLLDDGRIIRILPLPELLLEIRGDLPRLLWQIGWMKQLCQIEPDRLLVKDHPGVAQALRDMGAAVSRISGPFAPEPPYPPAQPHGPACRHVAPAPPNTRAEESRTEPGAAKNGPF